MSKFSNILRPEMATWGLPKASDSKPTLDQRVSGFQKFFDKPMMTNQGMSSSMQKASSYTDPNAGNLRQRLGGAVLGSLQQSMVQNTGVIGRMMEDRQMGMRTSMGTHVRQALMYNMFGGMGMVGQAVLAGQMQYKGQLPNDNNGGQGEAGVSIDVVHSIANQAAEAKVARVDQQINRVVTTLSEYIQAVDRKIDFEKRERNSQIVMISSEMENLRKNQSILMQELAKVQRLAQGKETEGAAGSLLDREGQVSAFVNRRNRGNRGSNFQKSTEQMMRAASLLTPWGRAAAGIAAGGAGLLAFGAGAGYGMARAGEGVYNWLSNKGDSNLDKVDVNKPIDVSIIEGISFATKKDITLKGRKIIIDAEQVIIPSLGINGKGAPPTFRQQGSPSGGQGMETPRNDTPINPRLGFGQNLPQKYKDGGYPTQTPNPSSGGQSGAITPPTMPTPSVPDSGAVNPRLSMGQNIPKKYTQPSSGGATSVPNPTEASPSNISGPKKIDYTTPGLFVKDGVQSPTDTIDFSNGGKDRYNTRIPASIRHNNPGASYPAEWMKQYGMNGVDIIGGGHKIANFPDAVSGAASNIHLMHKGYANKPLSEFITKWSGGNSSEAYAQHVAKALGVKPNDVVSKEFIEQHGWKLLKAQADWEKGRGGKGYNMSDEHWQAAQSRFRQVSGLDAPSDGKPRDGAGWSDLPPMARAAMGRAGSNDNQARPSSDSPSRFFFSSDSPYSKEEKQSIVGKYGSNVLMGVDHSNKNFEQQLADNKELGVKSHLYHFGPGGKTGGKWEQSELDQMKEAAKSVGIDTSKEWRGEWDTRGWKDHFRNQMKEHRPYSMEADNLDRVLGTDRKAITDYIKETQAWQKSEGIDTKLMIKNLHPDILKAIREDKGIDQSRLAPFSMTEKGVGDNRRIAEETRKLGITPVFPENTHRYATPGNRMDGVAADGRQSSSAPAQDRFGMMSNVPNTPIELRKGERGEFNYSLSEDGQREFGVPGQSELKTLSTLGGKKYSVNARAADSIGGFVTDLETRGYNIGSIGGYNYRNKAGGGGLSTHATGTTIDINPNRNGMGSNRTDMPANVEKLGWLYGMSWGARFNDAMHFEKMSPQARANKLEQLVKEGFITREVADYSLKHGKPPADYNKTASEQNNLVRLPNDQQTYESLTGKSATLKGIVGESESKDFKEWRANKSKRADYDEWKMQDSAKDQPSPEQDIAPREQKVAANDNVQATNTAVAVDANPVARPASIDDDTLRIERPVNDPESEGAKPGSDGYGSDASSFSNPNE